MSRRRLVFLSASVIALTAVDSMRSQAQSGSAPRLSVPSVQIEFIAPTVVRLTAQTRAGERVYHVAGRKRRAGENWPAYGVALAGQSYTGTQWSGLDSVQAGATYQFQFRAVSGTVTPDNSEWSDEVVVTTPDPPSRRPAAPQRLSAKTLGSFQVELTWHDASDNEYGFEIQTTEHGSLVRVALLNPNTTGFVVHGRSPGSTATFAVRAFNPAGVSQAISSDVVHLPPLSAADKVRSDGAASIGACRTREEAIRDVEAASDSERAVLDRSSIEHLGGALNLEAFKVPGSCGSANCSWALYGNDSGCYRKLGELWGSGFELVGKTPAGRPLILQLEHRSAMEAGFTLLKLETGRFVRLDQFVRCADPGKDLTMLSPLFDECQFTEQIRPPGNRQ